MSSVIEKMLSRIKPSKRRGKELGDLGMIADELAEALMSDNAKGVADSLRAAFACMSDDNAKGYAKGGMVKEDEEEEEWDGDPDSFYADDAAADDGDDDDDDYNLHNAKPVDIKEWNPSAIPNDGSMDYYSDDGVTMDRYGQEEWQSHNDEAYKKNVDYIKGISTMSGSDIGDRIDQDLLDFTMSDPYKYVEVRSNPKAYAMWTKAFNDEIERSLKTKRETGETDGVDAQKIYDLLNDPKFWEAVNDPNVPTPELTSTDRSVEVVANKPANESVFVDSDGNGFDDKTGMTEEEMRTGVKSKLYEMVDPDTGTTHLVDNPQKALRKAPKAKLVRRTLKPKSTPLPSRTITVGPMR